MPEFSMRGSGIYSGDITVLATCQCWGCSDDGDGCGKEFDAEVVTDDWGNVDQIVQCPECKHTTWVRRDAE